MKTHRLVFLCLLILPTIGWSQESRVPFGTTSEGSAAFLFSLKNKNGMEARMTNYGGIIVSLFVPDRNGERRDVVLGYDSLAPYVETRSTFGALIGRYANRIGGATFTLNGRRFELTKNSGRNHIHGGNQGFNKILWDVNEKESVAGTSLVLTHESKDGEDGYPGNLSVRVVYSVTDQNELQIDYSATTDKPTVINLTNHAFFNLAGAGSGTIVGEELFIDANSYTPTDTNRIPTGEFTPVRDTPFDFTLPAKIGSKIDDEDAQLKRPRGYDHNLVLNKPAGSFGLAAKVTDHTSGITMETWTTEPGIQLYTANALRATGKGGKRYEPRGALCLETQHFPDSPNKPQFPSTVLNPGEKFSSRTVYRFVVR